MALEHAGWRSLCEARGGDFYGRTMTDDGLMVLANGDVMTRDEVVDALSTSPAWDRYAIADARYVALDDDSLVLVYRGTGWRADGSAFVGAMASTYTRRAGEWRLALYQQTPAPDR